MQSPTYSQTWIDRTSATNTFIFLRKGLFEAVVHLRWYLERFRNVFLLLFSYFPKNRVTAKLGSDIFPRNLYEFSVRPVKQKQYPTNNSFLITFNFKFVISIRNFFLSVGLVPLHNLWKAWLEIFSSRVPFPSTSNLRQTLRSKNNLWYGQEFDLEPQRKTLQNILPRVSCV